jgi:tRNA A-37 threonylcarbamoyl transferase component Bud32
MVPPPQRIGRYRIREVIGTGGFATVYRATDERLDVDVAVKVLAENHSLDPDVRERFIAEGRRLRLVHSPHVVAVHDLGDTEYAQPYLVLEWADRGDLATRAADVRRDGRAPGPADALAVARTLARALRVLHAHDLVHRDLAPGNVLLRSTTPATPPAADGTTLIAADEHVLLADLGLSKDLAVASGISVAGGTSGFTSPEQRKQGGTVDSRADVWAASALIVWLATGQAPDEADQWRWKLQDAGWPSQTVPALARGVARRPQDRYPTIDEWLRALERALSPPPEALPDALPVARGASPSASRPWARPLVVMLAVLAVLLGGVLGVAISSLLERGPAVRNEQIAEGQQRTTVQEHDITIVIEGPTEAAVGERQRLAATVRGTSTWTWVGPDGVLRPGAETFEMVPRSPGRATVRLLATDDQGRVVEATRQLRVSDDDGS